ncbi:glycogen/starch synthase [bacterium]|nr:glycogen/starch synthase [bacterium]
MKSMLKILMVFSEVAPFTNTGELGNVGGALPKALKDLGHDVRVITPQYRIVNERKYVLRDVIRLQDIDVPLGDETVRINVKSAFLPNSKVQIYFIDYKPFFFRDGLYVDNKNGKDYQDNDRRFILFSKGVLETLTKLQWQPDVIHCNDWQSGLIPFFLKTMNKDNPFFHHTSSLFTVHNFNSQGNFHPNCLSYMGVNGNFVFPGSGIEFHGHCSFLKAGIVYADAVNIVSNKYSTPHQPNKNNKYNMEEVLNSRREKYYSISSGIDYSVWNPEVDNLIPFKYGIKDIGSKQQNKRALLEKYHIPYSEETAVLAIISNIIDDEGLALMKKIIGKLMEMNIVLILIGQEIKAYYQFFKQVKKKYSDRLGIDLVYDLSTAHLIKAGADIVLVPSKYDTHGLDQLSCLKYGSVPIVYSKGEEYNSIKTFHPETGKGTGFVFNRFNGSDVLRAVKRAVATYSNKKLWFKIMKNGMREDFSWNISSKKYIQLYSKCISRKK